MIFTIELRVSIYGIKNQQLLKMFKEFVDNMRSVLSIFADNTMLDGHYHEEARTRRRLTIVPEISTTNLYLKSNILQRVVETIPQLALETEIIINTDSEDEIDKEQLQKRFRDWQIKEKFYEATISARIYKESYLILDINDGTAVNKSINWDRCVGLNDVTFVEFEGLEINWNDQETERVNYKLPGTEIEIHPERILVFCGKRLTAKAQAFNGGHHSSQIEATIEAYDAYVSSLNEGNHLLKRLVTFVLKMGGLKDFIDANENGIATIQSRLNQHKKSIGGFGALCIDKESEEIEWISYSLAGVPEIINKTQDFFIANTELTHDMVMNEGSHDTASLLEDKNTQRKIKSFIQEHWVENLNTICQIITCEFYPKADILFTLELPEPSLSQLETITSRYTQAQTDSIYYTMGVLNQETIQESRFASSNPWEIALVNPGVFPEPEAPNESTAKEKNKTTTTKTKKTDTKFTDSIDAVPSDYVITADALEDILARVKEKNPLVFAFIEANEDNSES